jgi:hypothetical protein
MRATPVSGRTLRAVRDGNGNGVVHLLVLGSGAAPPKDVEVVAEKLLKLCSRVAPELISCCNLGGSAPIHDACAYGSLHVVQALLCAGCGIDPSLPPSSAGLGDNSRRTPVSLLVARLSDSLFADKLCMDVWAEFSKRETFATHVTNLLEDSRIDLRLAMDAIAHVVAMSAAGAKLIDFPVLVAVVKRRPPIDDLRKFLSGAKGLYSLEARENGVTALWYAVSRASEDEASLYWTEACKALVAKGAAISGVQDWDGTSMLERALCGDNAALLDLLLAKEKDHDGAFGSEYSSCVVSVVYTVLPVSA